LMSVVPLEDVWVVANLKETEVQNVAVGDRVEFKVDSYPGRKFWGTVESLSPASGARFSLLPPDNATGNFTKVVQRIPVRFRIDGLHRCQRDRAADHGLAVGRVREAPLLRRLDRAVHDRIVLLRQLAFARRARVLARATGPRRWCAARDRPGGAVRGVPTV